jgi:hypothetical protein
MVPRTAGINAQFEIAAKTFDLRRLERLELVDVEGGWENRRLKRCHRRFRCSGPESFRGRGILLYWLNRL